MLNQPSTVINAQVITATGQSGTLGADGSNLDLAVNVSAVSGTTPSLTVSLQWSMDGVNWDTPSPADAFTAITAVGNVVERFAVKAPSYRITWVVSGTTPSFTVTAIAWDS